MKNSKLQVKIQNLRSFGLTKVFLFLTVLFAPLYVVRFKVGPYPSTLLEVLIGLTAVSWAVEKVRSKNFDLRFTIYELPIALFLTAAALSVVVSPDKRNALGIFKAYFVEPILVFIIIKDAVRIKRDWWLVFLALALSGLWVALLAIFQRLTGQFIFAPHEAALGRAHAVYNTANAVGLYLGPIILLVLGAWQNLKSQISNLKATSQISKLRWMVLFAVVVMILAIVFSKSAGALVGLMGGLGVLVAFRVFGVKWLNCNIVKLLGLVALLVGVWFFLNISNFTPKNTDPFVRRSSDTLQFRLCLWEGTKNLLLARPIFGAGLSGFKELYSQRYFTCDAEPLEYPHSWILNFWAETGILGLLSFLGVLGVYFRRSGASGEKTEAPTRRRRGGRHFEKVKKVERVKRGLGAAFAAAMVYWLVHGLVDVPYFKNDLSLEFWVIVGLVETLGLAL